MTLRPSLRIQIFLVVIVLMQQSFAGGPTLVGSPTFGVDGKPFVWDNSVPIRYTTDGGSLGTFTNAAANSLVGDAFLTWSSVGTAKLSFLRAGSIQGIADGDVSTIAEFNQASALCDNGQSPIVYDDTGEIFTALFGDPSVVGFAGPCSLNSGGKIVTAFAAFSGPSTLRLDSTLVKAVMVHEFGHLIGLDHSQVDCFFSCPLAIPTMYYTLVSAEQGTLAPDDIAWVSKLYPSTSFASSYGTISGRVFFSDGIAQVQDAVVTAVRADLTAVSAVSGNYFTGNPGQPFTANYLPCTPVTACPNGFLGDNTGGDTFGSRTASLIGYYEIAVPPGQYTIEVHPITPSFGPVAIGPVSTPLDLPGPGEFWNVGESATDVTFDDPLFGLEDEKPGIVNVTPGSQITGVDVILNGTAPSFDEYDGGLPSSAGVLSPAKTTGGVR